MRKMRSDSNIRRASGRPESISGTHCTHKSGVWCTKESMTPEAEEGREGVAHAWGEGALSLRYRALNRASRNSSYLEHTSL